MSKKAIVIICDDNFLRSAIHTIKSIDLYGNFSGDIIILSTYLSQINQETLRLLGCVIKIQGINSIQNKSDYPDIVLLKYYLFTEYFKQWDKIMYLDADTSVICDINELFLSQEFSAVYDCSFSTLGTQILMKHISEDIPLDDKYPDLSEHNLGLKLFNVGFFVFDTSIINNKTYNELVTLNNSFSGLFRFPEQPILNIYFNGKINFLPMYYNNYVGVMSQLGYEDFQNPDEQFGILHFCGKYKHFLKNSPYYDFYISVINNKKIKLKNIDLLTYHKRIIKANLETNKKHIKYSDFHKCSYLTYAPIMYKNRETYNAIK